MPAVADIGTGDESPWLNPDATPFIKLRGVSKQFGAFRAVNDIDLDIYQGELYSLLGGSGCGKTTLLRMLAGFETPTQGSIVIDGIDMANIPPYERPVNMMFQSYALFPHMNVEKNVGYGLRREGVPRAEIRQRVGDMLELVELSDFTRRKPQQLSGGQRQRVALARALIKKPKVLLLDEPLGALDKRLREQTQFELMNLQDKLGITFVVVTHDQEEAMTLSTRIAVMDQGKFVQIGTPAEIYENPCSRFVASFIGSANLLDAVVEKSVGELVTVQCAALGCSLEIEHASSVEKGPLEQGAHVTVAIRPEKLLVSKHAPADNQLNVVQGTVREMAYLGRLSTYHIALDDNTMLEATAPNQKRFRDNKHAVDWDDHVYISFAPDSAVLLSE